MKVILLKEVRGKGGEGDVIDVSRGFANNYLLTQGYAVLATKGNLKQLEERRKNIAKREEQRVAKATALKEQLEGAKLQIKASVGEEGVLFGSVTSQMIADAIQETKGVEVDRRRIEIHHPIKTVGEHPITVALYRDIRADVVVNVVDEAGVFVPETEEAPAEEAAEEAAEEEAVEA